MSSLRKAWLLYLIRGTRHQRDWYSRNEEQLLFAISYRHDCIDWESISDPRTLTRKDVFRQASILLIDDFYRIRSGSIRKANSSHC
jgi:hypothetical protein